MSLFCLSFTVLVGYYGCTSWYNFHVSDCANRYMRVWSLDPFCHFLVGIRNFVAQEPFKSAATPFWWGFVSLFGFFRSPTLRFGAMNRYCGLLASLLRYHSFSMMQSACAFLRLVSWLLSFGCDISHVRKTVQPDLGYRCRYSEPVEVRFRFDVLLFRPCVAKV